MSFPADVRCAWRSVARSPGSTLIIATVLALGVGANTAVLTLVNAVVWKQLPFRDPQRLVSVWSRRSDRDKAPLSIPDFQDFRASGSLDDMAAFALWGANLGGKEGPERLQGLRSTANVFRVLGVAALRGRTLVPEDDAPGAPRVIVLSHGLWQRRFGADPDLIGKTLSLNGASYMVVGILPREFFFLGRQADFVVPLVPMADPRRVDRGDHFLAGVGRLKGNAALSLAEEQLTSIAQELQTKYPSTNTKNTGVRLIDLNQEVVGDFRSWLFVLAGAAGVLLLMTCSSLANLSLTLALERRRELAIRMSLGAGGAAILRQLLGESVLKSLFGGALAIAIALGGVRLLVLLSPAALPRLSEVQIDGRSLALNMALAILSGVLIGLLPAMRLSRCELAHEIRAGSRSVTEGGAGLWMRGVLSGAQIAFSLMLLISAGLLLHSFVRLQAVRPGFEPSRGLVMRLALMQQPFPTTDAIAVFYSELRRRLQALPGVSAAGAVSILPMSGLLGRADFTVNGSPPRSVADTPSANYRIAGTGYFSAMKIQVVRGRDFTESDTAHSLKVAVVNETLAKRLLGGVSGALGAHLRIEGFGSGEVGIVGVVGDVRQVSLADEPGPDLYLPYTQAPPGALGVLRNNMFWVIRSGQEPSSLSGAARRAVLSMNKDVAVSSTMELPQYVGASIALRRFNLFLLAAFAASAMLLAVVAVYGVVSHAVARRTREMGLRIALGAQRIDVLKLVIGQGLILMLCGVGVGLAASAGATRLLSGLLYQTKPFDWTVFASASGLLIATGLLASYIPANRATSVDPLVALRQE